MKSTSRLPFLSIFSLVLILGMIGSGSLFGQAALLQELYQKASKLAAEGNFQGALEVYNEIEQKFAPADDPAEDFSWSDFGPTFGGIFYDKGVCELQLRLYDKAKESFRRCNEDYPPARRIPYGKRKEPSPVNSDNKRWELSIFQLGYTEQLAENYQGALDLYQKFLDSKPDQNTLKQVSAAFTLRKGVCLNGIGKFEEGEAEILRLFTEANTTFRGTSGQMLFQAMLDLSSGWVKRAETDKEAVNKSAKDFMEKYGNLFAISAYDKAYLGFVERLRQTGYEMHRAGLYEVALRFFAMVPTTYDILADLEIRAAQTGGPAKAAYEQKIQVYREQLNNPDPPEVDALRVVASCWEGLGNRRAGYVINRYLIDTYPTSTKMPEIVHEAARYSFALGDATSAQYYGEYFLANYPDHKLRENVNTFMLQALFRNRKYEVCLDIAAKVRANHPEGAPQRELADFVYAGSLYYLNRQKEAEPEIDYHVAKYPESSNRESSLFFQESTRMIQAKYTEAAPLVEAFLKAYPTSPFRDQALYDRATCHYVASEFPDALARLDEISKESPLLDRGFNLKGDTLREIAKAPENEEKKDEIRGNSYAAYKEGRDTAVKLDHGPVEAEALFKLVDLATEIAAEGKEPEKYYKEAVEYYDAFFPKYDGNYYEAQMAVYAMPALESVNQTDRGLAQLEKVIVRLSTGNNVELLSKAIGSYHETSLKAKDYKATVAKYHEIIAANEGNSSLQSWLMIHEIMAYQSAHNKAVKDDAEQKRLTGEIHAVFMKLTQFPIPQLSDPALKAIGEHLEKENPFEAKAYFEELLTRETDTFKAPAEMALGRIEMMNDATMANAAERFKRVINNFQDPVFEALPLMPEAHLNLGRISFKKKDWATLDKYLIPYINTKTWDTSKKQNRAEAGYLYASSLEQRGDLATARNTYLMTVTAYGAYPEWSALCAERVFDLAYKEAAAEADPAEKELKQTRAYIFLRRNIFSWQNFEKGKIEALDRLRALPPKIETEMGLSASEIKALETANGLQAN